VAALSKLLRTDYQFGCIDRMRYMDSWYLYAN